MRLTPSLNFVRRLAGEIVRERRWRGGQPCPDGQPDVRSVSRRGSSRENKPLRCTGSITTPRARKAGTPKEREGWKLADHTAGRSARVATAVPVLARVALVQRRHKAARHCGEPPGIPRCRNVESRCPCAN